MVTIARGSFAETETFLLLATQVGLVTHDKSAHALGLVDETGRMLNALLVKLRAHEGAGD